MKETRIKLVVWHSKKNIPNPAPKKSVIKTMNHSNKLLSSDYVLRWKTVANYAAVCNAVSHFIC